MNQLKNKESSVFDGGADGGEASGAARDQLDNIIERDILTAHFQAIFSARNGMVYGYESLARLKSGYANLSAEDMFKLANLSGKIVRLDAKCRENAIRLSKIAGIGPDQHLFINVSPASLTSAAKDAWHFDELASRWGIAPHKIVLEIVEDVSLTSKVEAVYAFSILKERGYKIALDDFGSGYAGLQTLATIKPDYIKIDKSLISGIDSAPFKKRLVESIITACHDLGVSTVAEGLEASNELDVVMDLGVEFLQGYFLGRPSASISDNNACEAVVNHRTREVVVLANPLGEVSTIGEIARKVDAIPPSFTLVEVFQKFLANPDIKSLPVVENGRVRGILQRNRFLESHVLGRHGYGMHLNRKKSVGMMVDTDCLIVEASTALEDVSGLAQKRPRDYVYDDICVVNGGLYLGVVSVINLLNVITGKALSLARGSNPLTGLPGNEFIHREVEKRLGQQLQFDVSYIDLDNFKPYNDCYGFAMGDNAIRALAESIMGSAWETGRRSCFVGHIGGDDFIVISPSGVTARLCERIIGNFESRLLALHGEEDFNRGCYVSKTRNGDEMVFRLLSISIGVVSAGRGMDESYARIASSAAEVKKAAKAVKGSSIICDKRKNEAR